MELWQFVAAEQVKLINYARTKLDRRHQHLAEDIVQDAFLAIVRLDNVCDFRLFAYRAVKQAAWTYNRKRQINYPIPERDSPHVKTLSGELLELIHDKEYWTYSFEIGKAHMGRDLSNADRCRISRQRKTLQKAMSAAA